LKEKAALLGQTLEICQGDMAEREAGTRSICSSQPSEEQWANELRSSTASSTPLPVPAGDPRPEPTPIRLDEGGVFRVGKSRVSLDLIVEQYEMNVSPDEMVHAYDALALADVHTVIAHYLRHKDEVRAYLRGRKEEAEDLQARIEIQRQRISREELLAIRRVGENENALTKSPCVIPQKHARD
jgi:uncharacterized protein (DUF433 family)